MSQEEELDLWVLMDTSGSMNFGDPNKFDHARRIAAALAYIGMANMDSATVAPFGADLRPSRQRLRGKGQIFRLLDELAAIQPAEGTDLKRTIKTFTTRVRRPGLVVLLSDFYGLAEARAAEAAAVDARTAADEAREAGREVLLDAERRLSSGGGRLAELEGQQNQVAIESLEIAHEGLIRLSPVQVSGALGAVGAAVTAVL